MLANPDGMRTREWMKRTNALIDGLLTEANYLVMFVGCWKLCKRWRSYQAAVSSMNNAMGKARCKPLAKWLSAPGEGRYYWSNHGQPAPDDLKVTCWNMTGWNWSMLAGCLVMPRSTPLDKHPLDAAVHPPVMVGRIIDQWPLVWSHDASVLPSSCLKVECRPGKTIMVSSHTHAIYHQLALSMFHVVQSCCHIDAKSSCQ